VALTERLQIIIEAVGSGAAARDIDRVGTAAKGLAGQAKAGKFSLDGLASSAGISAGVLKAGLVGGVTAAGAAIAAFGANSIDAFFDLGQEVLRFQRLSGTTAEEASALVAAADDMGLSTETTAKNVYQLARRLETTAPKLAEFGIQAQVGADGNTDMAATLLSVADAYVATADPARRAALLNAAFGRSGAEMIPLLEQGAAGIRALYESAEETGQILSQDEVDKAEDYRLAVDNLHDTVNEFALSIGSTLVPALTRVVDGLAGFIEKVGGLDGAASDANDQTTGLLETLADFAAVVFTGADGLEEEAAAAAAATKDTFGLAQANRTLIETEEAAAAAADKLEASLVSTVGAQRSYDSAVRGVTSAQQRLSDAQTSLNEILARGAVDAKAVASAQREVTSASRALLSAQERMADAQKTVNDLNKELADLLSGKTGAEKVADAEDDLTDARSDHQHAIYGEARAAERLFELQNSGTATGLDLMEASQDLADAREAETRAAEAERQAEADLLTAQKVGTENSAEVIAVRSDLKDANKELGLATEDAATAATNLTTAQQGLTAAQAGDLPGFNRDLAAARRDVASASSELSSATYNASQQAWALYQAQKKEAEALAAAGPKARDLRIELERLADLRPELVPFIQGLLNELPALMPMISPFLAGGGGAGPLPGYRMVPAFQGGGIVKHRPGGMLANVGEGRYDEAIIPLKPGGGAGGGGTVVFNVNGYLGPGAESELARVVQSALLQIQRRNGTTGLN
jgi:hypothetical protein